MDFRKGNSEAGWVGLPWHKERGEVAAGNESGLGLFLAEVSTEAVGAGALLGRRLAKT